MKMLKAVLVRILKGFALLGGSLVLVVSVQARAASHLEGKDLRRQPACSHEFVPDTQSKQVFILKNKRDFEVYGYCKETI